MFDRLLGFFAPLGWWAALALAGLVGVLKVQAWHQETLVSLAQSKAAQAETRTAQIVAAYASAAASAASAAQAETSRRVIAQGEANDEAQRLSTRARADAAGAAAAGAGLRDAARTVAARCGGLPSSAAAVATSASSPEAGPLLAELLGELAERGGRLAAALDESRIAGYACARSYDALMK